MWVVEVWFEGNTRIGFLLRNRRWSQVETVILCASLQHYALGFYGGLGKGIEEVGQEGCYETESDLELNPLFLHTYY